jgi:hypothetical protein
MGSLVDRLRRNTLNIPRRVRGLLVVFAIAVALGCEQGNVVATPCDDRGNRLADIAIDIEPSLPLPVQARFIDETFEPAQDTIAGTTDYSTSVGFRTMNSTTVNVFLRNAVAKSRDQEIRTALMRKHPEVQAVRFRVRPVTGGAPRGECGD